MPTLFSQIIKGDIDAYKVYEDEYTLAFLDIRPMARGHILVVPKIEIDHFIDVPEPYYTAVFQSAKTVGKALMQSMGSMRIATLTEGFEIPHFHLHLIPMYKQGDLDIKDRLSIHEYEMEEIQQKIIGAIEL